MTTGRTDIYRTIVDRMTEHLGLDESDIEPHKALEELGLDSLGLVELGRLLYEEFEVDVTAFRPDTTLAEVVEAVESAHAVRAER